MGNHSAFQTFLDFSIDNLEPAEAEVFHFATRKADKMMVMIAVRTKVVVESPIGMNDLNEHPAR